MKTPSAKLPILTALLLASSGLAATEQPCANQDPHGPTSPPCKCPPCCDPADGMSMFSSYSGNASRIVTDLSVFGSVGKMPLQFHRYSNTRMAPQASSQGRFGREAVWTHNYQWFLRDGGPYSDGRPTLKLGFPDGGDATFVQGITDPNQWLPPANANERIVQNGTLFTLQTWTGELYNFVQRINGNNAISYRIENSVDSEGNTYTFTYNSATDSLLRKVADASGRWLSFTYVNQGAFAQQSPTLGSIPYNTPPGAWQEIAVTNTKACRFLTLYYSNDFHNAPAIPVGELEFYDENDVKINGTPFGSDPYFNNDPAFGAAKAFDGDTSTYYRYAFLRNGYVGLDLGPGGTKRVSRIRLFVPIVAGANPTAAAQFVGLNDISSANDVIKQVSAGEGATTLRSVTYDYSIFVDPSGWFRWGNLDRVNYPDGAATYTYVQMADFTRPILSTANDPRHPDSGPRIAYEFDPDTSLGFLRREKSGLPGGAVIAETAADGAHKPKVNYTGGPNGQRTIKYEHYLTNGNLKTSTDALGKMKTFTWADGNAGQIATVKDENGHTTTYTTTPLGRPLSITHPDGCVETWTRDGRDRELTYIVSGPGIQPRLTTYTRDPATGRLTQITYPDSSFEIFTYNALGKMLDHTLRNGGVEHDIYDARGLRTSHIDAVGNQATFTYDARDLLMTASLVVPGGVNQTTAYEYNDRGDVTKVTHADNKVVTYEYDDYGNQIARVDELGHRWTTTFDEFRRRISTSRPPRATGQPALTTTYLYDEPGSGGGCCGAGGAGFNGSPTGIILPSGKTILVTYDGAGRKIVETVGAGGSDASTTQYAYDDAGDLIRRTDPRGKIWRYTYDSRHRRLTASDPLDVTDPNHHTTQWTYDAAGNKLTERRPDGGIIQNTYDLLNRLMSTTDPKQQTTTYVYGGLAFNDGTAGSNLVRLTDANQHSYDFTYDVASRKTAMIYPGGSHENWTYDVAGNVKTYGTRAGQIRTMTYDQRNRETLADWNDTTPDAARSYDDAGRLISLNNAVSALSYTYNDANQLVTETQNLSGVIGAKTVTYNYDADGNRSAVTYPSGNVLGYTYTDRNQLKTVAADGPPPLVTYSYDLAGNRIGKSLENGATDTSYSYDDAGRLLSINHMKSGVTFQRFDYALDNVSNRTNRRESRSGGPVVTDSYAYDAIDQVTSVTYNANAPGTTFDRQVSYNYDPLGNRLSVVEDSDGSGPNPAITTPYTSNQLNQYTSIDALAQPAYDANGNLITIQYPGEAVVWNYTYDAQNRLITGTNGAGGSFNFSYDGVDRCISRTINGSVTNHLYSEWNVIEDRSSTGAVQAIYYHGERIDEILASVVSAGTACLHHHDGLGSVTALTDTDGNVVERNTYDVFGFPSFFAADGAALARSTVGNRWLFTGREWLAGTNLCDSRNRLYSANIGRWLSRDPIVDISRNLRLTPDLLLEGPNLYGYVRNSPANRIDPFGLDACTAVPDKPLGFDFTSACESHDKCYESCGADKDKCDNDFKADMEKICMDSYNSDKKCLTAAEAYFKGVQLGGKPFFDKAQKKAKKCCDKKK